MLSLLGVSCTSPTTEVGDRDIGLRLRPTTTVEDLMRSMIDPAADAVWDAVVTDVTVDGVVITVPETPEDWIRLRRHAVTLVESANLLLVEGRRVAASGSRSEMPGVDLDPKEIEALLSEDQVTWATFAENLRASGLDVLGAVDAVDVDALLEAGDRLDLACEQCHVHYWYPSLAPESAWPSEP